MPTIVLFWAWSWLLCRLAVVSILATINSMNQEGSRKVIFEDKIVVDTRTTARDKVTVTEEPSDTKQPEAVNADIETTETVADDRPHLLFVVTQGMWEEPQKYIIQLAEHFASQYQLHVVFGTFEFTGKNVFRERFEALGGTVHTIDSLTHKPVLGNELSTVFKLRKLLAEIKPDVVHCNDPKTSFLTGLARLMTGGSRQVSTVHGFRDTSDNKSHEVVVFEFFVKLGLNFSSTVVCRDQYTHQQATRMLGNKAQLVLPGIHEIHFLNPEEKLRSIIQDAPDKIGGLMREAGTVILGNVAPLEADQGIAYTLQALAKLKEKGVSFVYIHYGDGDQKRLLEHELETFGIKDRVLFKGLDKLANLYLQIFDIIVQPTLRPGDLTLLRDAGLARRAVVISDIDGITDAVTDGQEAVVVEQKNPEAIAEEIAMLAQDKAKRDQLGAALEKRIRENYSEEEMFRKTEAIYEG